MKKWYIAAVAMIMTAVVVLTGCSCKKKENVIRLNEVTHSVFYAPLYIAINKGFFEDENIKIELTNGQGADKSMAALLSGSADIALLGPEAAIYNVAQGNPDAPKVFGQLTKRDGSFLVGRTAQPNFKWSDLEGKEIIAGRRGGVPAMTLEYALNLNGLYDGVNVTLNYDIPFATTAAAYVGGTGDYVTIFEPTASQIQSDGQGYIVSSVGLAAGTVPFTAFTATQRYLNNNRDQAKAFLRAIIRAYNFLTTATLDEVVDALAPSFPDASRASLVASVESYRLIDAWSSSPVMAESDFKRLITIMESAGELDADVAFASVVDNSIARELMLELI